MAARQDRRGTGVRDVRLLLGVVVGMLLAGFVLPLAAREPIANRVATGERAGATRGSAGDTTDPGAVASGSGASVAGTGGAAALATGGPGSPAQAGGAVANGPGDGSAGAGEVARTASDTGVTADTVTLGVSILNLSVVQAAGVAATAGTVQENERIWQALVDDANQRGGVGGRRIQLAMHDFNPLDNNSGADVCRRITEDEHAFVAIPDGGSNEATLLCYTRHGLPTLAFDGVDPSAFADGGGLLFSMSADFDKLAYNHVMALHEHGYLAGRKIGLVTLEGSSTAPERVEVPTLEALGYRVVRWSRLSNDISTAQSQIPVEVGQMRANGVDLVIWEAGAVNSNVWLNQAQHTGYNPTYSFGSIATSDDDFGIQTASGKVDGYSWSILRRRERHGNATPSASDEACVQRAAQAIGHDIKRTDDQYWLTIDSCSRFSAFLDAMAAAGPNPTRASFTAAFADLRQRPDLEVGPGGVGGTWLPGKPDAADYMVELHEDVGCHCWVPASPWFPLKPVSG